MISQQQSVRRRQHQTLGPSHLILTDSVLHALLWLPLRTGTVPPVLPSTVLTDRRQC